LNGGNLITLPPRKHYLKKKSSTNLGTELADSFILPPRDVKVLTPPQYNDPKYMNLRYPVLYVHDGQNAIQDSSSWTGYSWRLAGALTRMAERKQLKTNEHSFPPIVLSYDP
jgi:enterochelin esterase-like enzyme